MEKPSLSTKLKNNQILEREGGSYRTSQMMKKVPIALRGGQSLWLLLSIPDISASIRGLVTVKKRWSGELLRL